MQTKEKTHMIETEKVTLEEYRGLVELFRKMVKKLLFIDSGDNEFFHIYNMYRDGFPDDDKVSYSGMYKSIERALDMIDRADDNIYADYDGEEDDIGDNYWWSIDKYRLGDDGAYDRIFHINQHGTSELFEIEFNYKFPTCATLSEKAVYDEWKRLNGLSLTEKLIVELPYKRGDILRIDTPYSATPDYCLYIGRDFIITKNIFGNPVCRNILSVGDMNFMPLCTKPVSVCPDKLYNILSQKLKEKQE